MHKEILMGGYMNHCMDILLLATIFTLLFDNYIQNVTGSSYRYWRI